MTAYRFAIGLWVALSCFGAQAADLAHVGPNASAASLIAARGRVQEPALKLVYKVEGSKPDTITIDLAEDFSVVRQGSALFIYDFALRRFIDLDDPSHSFRNASLYGLVDFFYAETYNRRVERQVLGQAKLDDRVAMLEPFWVQSQLHVMSPEDGAPKIDRHADKDGSVHFSYGGAEVASYLPSAHAMTKDEGVRLARLLHFYASIHPIIIDDIAAGGYLPQRLSFETVLMAKSPAAVWTLQSAVPVKAAFPLQAGSKVLQPKFEGAASVIAGLVPTMQAAIARQAPGQRSVADYRAAIEAAVASGKSFQALVLGLELSEQYGKQSTDCVESKACHSLREIVASAQNDPRTQSLLEALQGGSPQKSDVIKALQTMKRNDLSNGYVLDDFLANDLVAANRSDEALPLFAGAIKGNPYMAGYYKDLGDLFRFRFDPEAAWYFYDLGRTLPGGPDAPVIFEMNHYESGLAKRYPEFF